MPAVSKGLNSPFLENGFKVEVNEKEPNFAAHKMAFLKRKALNIQTVLLGSVQNNRLSFIALHNIQEHYSVFSDVKCVVFGNLSYTLTICCLDLLLYI